MASADMSTTNMASSDMSAENMASSDMSTVNIASSDMSTTNMASSDMSTVNMASSDMSTTNMASSDMSTVNMASSDMSTVNMASSDMSTVNMSSSDMSTVNMSSSDMSTVNMASSDMSETNMASSDMSTTNMASSDMSTVNMSSSDMSTVNMSSSDMSTVNMASSDMSETNMASSDMSTTNMASSDMSTTNMASSDMSTTNMASSDMSTHTAPGPQRPDRVVIHSNEGAAELTSMEEVLCSQLQDSETSFVQANSQIVADSERSRCVQTVDLKEASDILQDTGRVILCGFPGTGKTTVGHALLRRCRKEGFKPYFLSKLEDWHAHIGPGMRSFVLVDAILGEVRVNRHQYEEWRNILRNMLELIKTGDCRVVVTLYPHVLHELQQLETDSQSPLLDSSAVVMLMKEDLDTEVKRKLLDFHLKQLPLQHSQQQEVVERIVQADTSGPAFLWCCRYLVDQWQAVEDPATVFTSPAEAYSVLLKQMCLHETHGDSYAAVMALAMQGKGRFLHRKTRVQSELKRLGFKKYCDDHLAEYEDIMQGSVLSETDRGFSSRAWYDAAGLALGRSFRLPTLLEVCDVTFLVQHVHVTVIGGTQKALKILVGSVPFASLARRNKSVIEDCLSLTERLFKEINKGNLSEICQHNALQCPEFLLVMEAYCKQEKRSLKQLVRAVDTVHKLPLLYWTALEGQHTFPNWCLSTLYVDPRTRTDAKFLSPKLLLGLSVFLNPADSSNCFFQQHLFRKLFSAKSFNISEDIVFLPRHQTATHVVERTVCLETGTRTEAQMQQVYYLCGTSLPIQSTLVRVEMSDDTVRVQVRDRGDWYLALRLLADREVDETDRDGNTLLHIAADKGNLEAITLAVKSGASLTKTNNKGVTPYQLAQRRREKQEKATDRDSMKSNLGDAIIDGNEMTVKTLLSCGSSVNDDDTKGSTYLTVACQHGHGNIAALLIDLGADINGKAPSGRESPGTLLHHACRNGLTQAAGLLVKYHADINARNYFGDTALHYACQCECTTASADITRLLLDAGADVNARDKKGTTPIHNASRCGYTQTVTLLIGRGADVNTQCWNGRTPLHDASSRENTEIVTLLIDRGADVNIQACCGMTPILDASCSGCKESLTLLIHRGTDLNAKDTNGRTPLHHAYSTERPGIMTQLIEAGAETGRVHQAVVRGDVDALVTLLQQGADVNQHDTSMGCSPLHAACLMGRTDIVTCLTQHGAKVNDVDNKKRTPLHITCASGHTQVARRLIDEGAEVNARDERQSIPLHRAASIGNTEITLCLIEHGAEVNAATTVHTTPLHRACWWGHTETAQCLLQHGANVNSVSL